MSLELFRPGLKGMARPSGRQCFFTLYVAGCASVASATGYVGFGVAPMHVPHAVQVVLGLLMVFVVPGWSLVWAVLPELNSWVERLVASVAISVTVSTCAAVLLAATPMGFSRQPLGDLLGGFVVALSFGGLHRAQLASAVQELRASAIGEFRAWAKKLSIGEGLNAPRPYSYAKPRRDRESDVRRSVVALKFSFDGKPVDSGA
jgi:Protein of unknown function (DUF1616)